MLNHWQNECGFIMHSVENICFWVAAESWEFFGCVKKMASRSELPETKKVIQLSKRRLEVLLMSNRIPPDVNKLLAVCSISTCIESNSINIPMHDLVSTPDPPHAS